MAGTGNGGAARRRGLDQVQVAESREKNGANVLRVRKSKSFLGRFFENLGDPVIRILLVALGVNLIFVFKGGDIAESVGIAISVFLAAFISALSEAGGENAFRKLAGECAKQTCLVRRGGRVVRVPIEDVVVGDIVLVRAGEKIAADGYVIEGKLLVDQSAITGESKEKNKQPTKSPNASPDCEGTLFRGCTVVAGEGEMEVFAVGEASFLGKISAEVQEDTRISPLKLRLTKLARQISRLGYFAAFLVAAAYLFNCLVIDSGFEPVVILSKLGDFTYLGANLLHAFMLGLTVIVVAVPEGLPMMIAVVLSSNIRRMIKDKVLVKKPVGIEAAGSMNILFTDKTGTLTEGKMSVESLMLGGGEEYSCRALRSASPPVFERYVSSCLGNTSAEIVEGRACGGNGTDRALVQSVIGYAGTHTPRLIESLPFDSAKKYSAARVVEGKTQKVFIKGAPEKLLPRVRFFMREDGSLCEAAGQIKRIEAHIAEKCATGKRVLLVAECEEMPSGSKIPTLTLIAVVCLCDKLRAHSRDSVKSLQNAGIGVVMITGDAKPTARSIAEGCGIICRARDIVIDSAELAAMSDARLAEVLPRLAVVARALPTDKSRLVRVAQERELVVGMTGDGINDAPALKCADIGFSMGSGTDVAKDAGDIIILDDDLASIVKAMLYGRNIFKSIRKFITLQLTMNFCAVGVCMIGPFIGVESPVTVVQMLWINIIMDTLGGLAFAGEYPSPLCMREAPKRRDEPILNGYMVNQIVLLGSATIALCLAFLLSPSITAHFRYAPDGIYHLTAFFALFIFTSVINCFSARCDRLWYFNGIGKNPVFVVIMAAVCAVQVVFVYLGGSLLRTLPLSADELLYTLGLSLCVLPAEMLRRIAWRLMGKKNGF